MHRGPMACASVLVVALAGCGHQEPASTGSTDPVDTTQDAPVSTQPWLTADGDTLITCSGGPAFPASLVAEGGLEVSPEESGEFVAALTTMKEEFGIDAPWPLQEAGADEVQWTLLWQESVAGTEQAGILIAPPTASEFDLATDEAATLERQGDAWRASSWSGTCGARPALPAGTTWARVALPDEPVAPTDASDQAAATSGSDAGIDLLVSEIDCTSARDPEPYLAEPVVVETSEAVTVYWTTESMVGGADCPGNPWVPRSITLSEPLGDRDLLDGWTYPPQPVRTVQEIENGPPA